jgi:haloalkane dehalogenase
VFEENFFVEVMVPMSIIRRLDEQEMEAYRAPFREPASRMPTLAWPRELPVEGEPRDVVGIVEQYGSWLSTSPVPKLLIKAEPGAILVGPAYEFARTWASQREATVQGIHFIQEDSPDEIGAALREFVAAQEAT